MGNIATSSTRDSLVNQTNGTQTNNANSVASATKEQEDRFLKLLVTQLSNQDPLNPLDNAQVTTQLAQLSTVNGIQQLNTTLTNALQSVTQAQTYQASSLIGRAVLAPGSSINVANGLGAAGFDLASAADTVSIKVIDSKGTVVRTLDVGKSDAGTHTFTFDGQTDAGVAVPDGAYTFSVDAKNGKDNVEATALAAGLVNSVLVTSTGPVLSVDGLGEVNPSTVRQIL